MQPLNAAPPHAATHRGPRSHELGQPDHAGEFLTLRLGIEEHGIDILQVREIRSYEKPARMAHAPSFIQGVVTQRIKPDVSSVACDGFTVVDSDSGVLKLKPEKINAAPELNTSMDTSYITGIVSKGERMFTLMDIEALGSSADMGLIASATPIH